MMEEKARKMQIIAVISSIFESSAWSEMCNAVRTNKQKPSRFAAVPRICGDVLFAKNERNERYERNEKNERYERNEKVIPSVNER